MSDNDKFLEIEKVISDVLQNDFRNVKILDVRVLKDIDSDGDNILQVDVIFEGQAKDLEPQVLAGAVRHVRPKLFDIGEEAFPLFSYISQKDAGLTREIA